MAICPSARVLVVEDDDLSRQTLEALLAKEGLLVDSAADGVEMRACLERETPTLVLMDLGLPGEDGLALTRYLRERHDPGIIMLTAKSELTDRITGLEVGADDYITKPYEPLELLARVKSLLRRMELNAESDATPESSPVESGVPTHSYRFAGCVLDGKNRTLIGTCGTSLELTTSELRLLSTFVQRPYVPISREDLMQLVYGREWNPTDRSIDVLVTKLRRKLQGLVDDVSFVRSVRNVGYEFAVTVTQD